METSDYWTNFWRRRMGRRRVLTGAALAGSGLAASALVGCEGDGGAPSGSPAPRSSPTTAEAVYPHDARQAVVPVPPGMNGGTLHYVGFDPVVVDRYDPHQTAFGGQARRLRRTPLRDARPGLGVLALLQEPGQLPLVRQLLLARQRLAGP